MAANVVGLTWSVRHAETIYRQLAGKADPRYHSLMDPRGGLLARLEKEALGTYHHDIIVGNLAAPAAYHIGANADLARVGGYFHDVGKLDHPQLYLEYFTGKRNMRKPIDDPDDLVTILNHPERSSRILIREGFPTQVCEIALEHHGTIRTRLEISPELLISIPESVLYYKGPLPHTLESAIVMLADSCQALFENKSQQEAWPANPTREMIREFVEKVGRELREAGQFLNSGLTADKQRKVEGSIMWWLYRFYNGLRTTGTPSSQDVRRVENGIK